MHGVLWQMFECSVPYVVEGLQVREEGWEVVLRQQRHGMGAHGLFAHVGMYHISWSASRGGRGGATAAGGAMARQDRLADVETLEVISVLTLKIALGLLCLSFSQLDEFAQDSISPRHPRRT